MRDELSDHVTTTRDDIATGRVNLLTAFNANAEQSQQGLLALADSNLDQLETDNHDRLERFIEWSGSELKVFLDAVEEAVVNIQNWYNDGLEWTARLEDEHVRQELEDQLY